MCVQRRAGQHCCLSGLLYKERTLLQWGNTHTLTHTCTHSYMHAWAQTHTHTHIRIPARMHTHTPTRTHARMHTYIHLQTHTHAHCTDKCTHHHASCLPALLKVPPWLAWLGAHEIIQRKARIRVYCLRRCQLQRGCSYCFHASLSVFFHGNCSVAALIVSMLLCRYFLSGLAHSFSAPPPSQTLAPEFPTLKKYTFLASRFLKKNRAELFLTCFWFNYPIAQHSPDRYLFRVILKSVRDAHH